MAVYNDGYDNEEERRADLAWEYRKGGPNDPNLYAEEEPEEDAEEEEEGPCTAEHCTEEGCENCAGYEPTGGRKILPEEVRLIDAEALKKEFCKDVMGGLNWERIINNAPTVEPQMSEIEEHFYHRCGFLQGIEVGKELTRPQGEYVDIRKLRLMTVEECAGHTIDYAMGWKACVEWIKKGGAE